MAVCTALLPKKAKVRLDPKLETNFAFVDVIAGPPQDLTERSYPELCDRIRLREYMVVNECRALNVANMTETLGLMAGREHNKLGRKGKSSKDVGVKPYCRQLRESLQTVEEELPLLLEHLESAPRVDEDAVAAKRRRRRARQSDPLHRQVVRETSYKYSSPWGGASLVEKELSICPSASRRKCCQATSWTLL